MAMDKPATAAEPSAVRHRSRWTPGRVWALALVTFRQGVRMRLWVLVPLAILVLIFADLSSARFDPVFEAVPAAISTSLLVMAILAVIVGVFFSTYSMPAEVETKVIYSVVTKPVSSAEIVMGKALGMSLLVLAVLAPVGCGAYAYILVRAATMQSVAVRRLDEARPHAAYPADLNALEAVVRTGPLQTYRYYAADSGPTIEIFRGAEAPEKPGFVWILGETGMRLAWNLGATPLREWASAGPVRLRLALDAKPPPEAPDTPTQVQVSFEPPLGLPLREEGGPMPVYRAMLDVPASGELEVPVAAPGARPVQGVLNVPDEGDIVLEVMAMQAGRLVGAGPGAIRVVGPGGQEFAVKDGPERSAAAERRRVTLVGRSRPPRQVAVFRFNHVRESVLGAGDVPLEAAFSLDAFSPALAQTTAELVLVRPDTGERKTIPFTPESRHSTILYIDRSFWHGGPLEVRLQCLTDEDFIGLLPESVRLRLGGGPFALNFAKGILRVWFFGTVVAAVGVLMSMRLAWFVSILAVMVFLLVGIARDFLLGWAFHLLPHVPALPFVVSVLLLGLFGGLVGRLLGIRTVFIAGGIVLWCGASGFWYYSARARLHLAPLAQSLLEHVVLPVPEVTAFLPGESINVGRVMPLAEVLGSFGWALALAAVAVFLGAMALKRREVAA